MHSRSPAMYPQCQPPAMHAPRPCMLTCHACPLAHTLLCHACSPATHAPPAMHAPSPCMIPCHTWPPATHAPLPCMSPFHTHPHHAHPHHMLPTTHSPPMHAPWPHMPPPLCMLPLPCTPPMDRIHDTCNFVFFLKNNLIVIASFANGIILSNEVTARLFCVVGCQLIF